MLQTQNIEQQSPFKHAARHAYLSATSPLSRASLSSFLSPRREPAGPQRRNDHPRQVKATYIGCCQRRGNHSDGPCVAPSRPHKHKIAANSVRYSTIPIMPARRKRLVLFPPLPAAATIVCALHQNRLRKYALLGDAPSVVSSVALNAKQTRKSSSVTKVVCPTTRKH